MYSWGCLVLLDYLRACDAVGRVSKTGRLCRAQKGTMKDVAKKNKNYSYLLRSNERAGRVSARYAWCERRIVNWLILPVSYACLKD